MVDAVIALAIFVAAYVLMLTERVHRAIASMIGAALMVIAGAHRGFYSHEQAVEAVDMDTIGLLMGMMIIVALLEETGFFRYLAIKSAKLTGGSPWRLMVVLGLVTALVSMLIDNVSTIVFIAPVTILIADILRISPMPALVAEALLSNVGGVGTLVGDPPNIMIATAAGFTFNQFLASLMPVVLVVLAAGTGLLAWSFRGALAAERSNVESLGRLREQDAITDRVKLRKCGIAIGVTLVLFLLQGVTGLPPAACALIGATIALGLIRPDPTAVLAKVEWPVLMFFAGLFVIVGGLDHAGILEAVADRVDHIAQGSPVLAASAVLWLGAACSALIGNIPTAASLIPVVGHLQAMGVSAEPLWWALAIGVGFGGNASPFGAAANLVTISISERTRAPISMRGWIRVGLPMALVACAIGNVMIVLMHVR